MLYSLKELVFGLNEFEKAKIDERILQSILLVPQIKLSRLEDFDMLEECIYKLREQLRVKSSNLNRVIKSSNQLTKKQVLKLIKDLETIRYDFLKMVFTKYLPSETNQTQVETNPESKHSIEENTTNNDNNNEITTNEDEISTNKKAIVSEVELINTKNYLITLNNGKQPFIEIDFKTNEIDFPLIKYICTLFFDLYKMHGTNIIVEKQKAQIISREIDDNLFTLPKIQTNLEEDFNKLIEIRDKEENTSTTTEQTEKSSQDYIELDNSFKKQEIHTKKPQEDSLDALLQVEDEKNPLETLENETQVIKEEIQADNEIKIETDTEKPEIIEKEKEKKKEESEIELEIEQKDEKEEEEVQNMEIQNPTSTKSFQFEVYRDDKIIAYFETDSKVFGQLVITPAFEGPISSLTEGDLSYITIFSKVFASVLFELVQCHGTNIIWDFKSESIRIIPRFQNDNLNINWEPKPAEPAFLGELTEKLMKTMSGVGKQEPLEQVEIKESETLVDERAQHLLSQLRRIP